MFSNQASEISLNLPCRALAAVEADKTDSRFIAGSCDPDGSNHLHIIRFHSEVNELGVDAQIPHVDGPVQVVCCSPTESSTVVTATEGSNEAKIYTIPLSVIADSNSLRFDPEEDDPLGAAAPAAMEESITLTTDTASPIVDITWRGPSDEVSSSPGADLLTMNRNGTLSQWDIASGSVVQSLNVAAPYFTAGLLPRVAWDPHNPQAVAVTKGTKVQLLDWRVDTSTPTGTVESLVCHRVGTTDLDFNPNKPYILATSGQDGLVKFWDLRLAKRPLMTARGGHSHWVWNVDYNPFHDQLLLSTGTDSVANLWRFSTISSAPLLTVNDDEDDSPPNGRVVRHECGDSIYSGCWSAADAWIYLVASYDGKVVLNHVPSKEKYKILL